MSNMKLVRICTAILLVTIAVWSDAMKIEAQAFHRIYLGIDVHDLSWSPDGTRLSFNEGDGTLVSTTANVWYEYDPLTEILTATKQWPRQPKLTSEEIKLYQPITQSVGTSEDSPSFVFASPNDDYAVFASNLGEINRTYPLYIANRRNHIVAEIHMGAWEVAGGLDGLNVIWNRTSTAFVVTATAPTGGEFGNRVIGYVGNFSRKLTDLVMTSPDEIKIDGHNYWAADAYSVSDDGDSILVRAFDLNSSTGSVIYKLVIWNISTRTSIVVGNMDANKIRTANFDNGDPDKILMFNDIGIVRYTVSKDATEVITSQINADWAAHDWSIKSAFSSDGQWLAILRSESEVGVYVFNLSEDFTGLKVQYYPEATARTQYSDIIEGRFNIVNASDVDIALSDLTIRYFFSRDTAQPLQAACSWAALPNACDDVVVTAGIWIPPVNNYAIADSYMDIGFMSGTLAAHSETHDIIARVIKQDFSDFDQTNDYSFDPVNQNDIFTDRDDIALYYKGKMVWGIEPY